MKNVLKFFFALVFLLITSGGVVFFFLPGKIIDWTNASYASAAGLQAESVLVKGENIHFFRSSVAEKPETIVLVHGLGDDKNSFLQSAAQLSGTYNLILPDLRGHGENNRNETGDYSIAGQVAYLYDFLAHQGVEHFHLVGNSMGGHISAAYALKHPEQVTSLILVNAPGVSFEGVDIYTGFGDPLETQEDLARVMERIMYEPPSLPGPIADYMIKKVNAGLDFTDNVMIPGIKNGEDFDLKGRLTGISAPTLILWGEHDPVVNFGVAEYFDANVPLSEIEIIPESSHSPQLEKPVEVGRSILKFIEKY